jgi:hypothetical protein
MGPKKRSNRLPVINDDPITPDIRERIRRVYYQEGVEFAFILERFHWISPRTISTILQDRPKPREKV